MTIVNSGALTSTTINTETGQASFDMNATEERNLAGRYSGSYSWNDYYGQVFGGDCIEQTTPAQANTSSGTVSFAAVNFGSAISWNREVFLCVHWACTTSAVETTISSATIGGVAATLHTNYGEGGTSATSNYGAAIISAQVPTGTTGTVSITFSNATVRSVIITPYVVYGLVSRTPTDTGVAFDEHLFAPSSTSAGVAITRPDDDLSFFASTWSSADPNTSMSTTVITEQQEANFTPDGRYSNGFRRNLGAGTNTPTTTATGPEAARLRFTAASFACK